MSLPLLSEGYDGPHYYLPRHISLCALDDGLVILNQKSQRYSSLPGEFLRALAAVCVEWRADRAWCEDDSIVDGADANARLSALVRNGILTQEPDGAMPLVPLHIAASEAIDFGWGAEERSLRLRYVAPFLVAVARAAVLLRLTPFDKIVARVRRRREGSLAKPSQHNLETTKELAIQFRRLRPLVYTSCDACLFDSLVLLEFLALHACYPTWVIGVQSRPFLAHSWVQYEQCVLNGTVEYVQQFVPILIV
jgi:Transglutaminase-like superfamily